MYVCMYVCMHACMHAFIHLFIYTGGSNQARAGLNGGLCKQDYRQIYIFTTEINTTTNRTHGNSLTNALQF